MGLDSEHQPFLCNLATAELLPTMTFRLWVMAFQHPRSSIGNWKDGFASARLDQANVEAFDILGRTIVAARFGCIDVRWPYSQRLGEDEMRLLNCFRIMQRQETHKAILRLSAWLEPTGARMAFGPVYHLTESFRDAGLWFPERDIHPGLERAVGTCDWMNSTTLH